VKKALMLFLIASVTMISTSSCTKKIVRERIVTGDARIDAVIDSLQTRLGECDKIRIKCCDIVEENLKNN